MTVKLHRKFLLYLRHQVKNALDAGNDGEIKLALEKPLCSYGFAGWPAAGLPDSQIAENLCSMKSQTS